MVRKHSGPAEESQLHLSLLVLGDTDRSLGTTSVTRLRTVRSKGSQQPQGSGTIVFPPYFRLSRYSCSVASLSRTVQSLNESLCARTESIHLSSCAIVCM